MLLYGHLADEIPFIFFSEALLFFSFPKKKPVNHHIFSKQSLLSPPSCMITIRYRSPTVTAQLANDQFNSELSDIIL